uniref:Uncharacterized protein n=1 Tax=Arundo donax TaxID=35708 RepID=A0A0A8Y1H3_ARUDO
MEKGSSGFGAPP